MFLLLFFYSSISSLFLLLFFYSIYYYSSHSLLFTSILVVLDSLFISIIALQSSDSPDSSGVDPDAWISRVDRREILSNLYQLIGSINANFGDILNQPVHFLLSPLSVEDMVCLYGIADVAFITPLRYITDSCFKFLFGYLFNYCLFLLFQILC